MELSFSLVEVNPLRLWREPRLGTSQPGNARRSSTNKSALSCASCACLVFFSQFSRASRRSKSSTVCKAQPRRPRLLLLGGCGRIGTAAAVHLMKRAPGPLEVILAGRKPERGKEAVEEVKAEVELDQGHDVSFCQVDWQKPGTLPLDGVDVLLHTAGPFDGEPTVLQEALEKRVPIYVDVADPMSYLDAAEALDDKFRDAECMALCSAGAFPGFSNILAIECAQRLRESGSNEVQDLNFSYFTAGLGGSGPVNLLITNLGFGDPVPVFQNGKYAPQMVAGSEMRKVDFFLDEGDPAFKAVGRRDVWSWPFPEAGTVPRRLKIQGNSSTGMGTAPGIWNDILVALVSLVPRELWRQRGFSEALANFSLPMVWVTDQFVKETHAMRVEATSPDGRNCVCVQTHQSFRRCVAQSSAEFVLHLLERRGFWGASPFPWQPGVYLPERLAEDKEVREELLERLTTTEGTISCGFQLGESC